MIHEKYDIKFSQGNSVLHRITQEGNQKVVFLVHGYFEDSKIFYSKSGKGFAPYLAQNGYDVFMCDLVGKGESAPKIAEGLDHSQHEIITRDIPKYLEKIREISGQQEINLGGHSWGGVVALAYLSRFKDQHIKSIITFGSKRRIGRKNLRKLVMIDLAWDWYGNKLVKKHGYLPAEKMKMGNQDEPKSYYEEANHWVYCLDWKDPEDDFNYRDNFDFELPPMLFITGKGDKILGHPKDVEALMNEANPNERFYKVIGKSTGHLNDYDHINLLTHKDAVKDHFPLVLEFLEKFN